MYFNAVSVAVFALLSLAGAKADDKISTAGLVVDDKQVASYCGVPVKPEYKEVEFVCFTYKGDIQKAMTNPNRLKGFVNKAGNGGSTSSCKLCLIVTELLLTWMLVMCSLCRAGPERSSVLLDRRHACNSSPRRHAVLSQSRSVERRREPGIHGHCAKVPG